MDAFLIERGRYLYCIAEVGERVSLGRIGIGGDEVYTIPYHDIGAVVHDCQEAPYQAYDEEAVKGWVVAHQRVVDTAWERWGSVLPTSFGTIVKGESGEEAERNLVGWLRAEHESLKSNLERLRGKAEYGVQIFWDPEVIAQGLTQTNPEISGLQEEIRGKPRGLAYLHGQRLENLIRREMETKADQCFRDFFARIRKHAQDIRVETTKRPAPDLQMLMSVSCLLPKERETDLGEELEQINRMEGFSVRFTGPWPPYSFVGGAG